MSRFDRETLPGFVNPVTHLQPHSLELLTTGGAVVQVPYAEIKAVLYVRELDGGEPPWQNRSFTNRPRMEGLWIRMRFVDGDTLEGVLTNNLLQLESLGFTVIPPDAGAQSQKLFVPRTALSAIAVLGVIGSPLRPRKRKAPTTKEQIELFDKV